nr:MAG TPA: Membrane fusion protein Use1 [Bacteriophage sp.]
MELISNSCKSLFSVILVAVPFIFIVAYFKF